MGPAVVDALEVRRRAGGLPVRDLASLPMRGAQPVRRFSWRTSQFHWLVAPYGEVAWVRNARAAGEAELRRAGTAERVLVREATAGEAAPVLRSYLRQLRFVVGPYFDVTRSSPDAAFAAEAPRHPVFLLTRPSAWQRAAESGDRS
jgi:hypothetical protein